MKKMLVFFLVLSLATGLLAFPASAEKNPDGEVIYVDGNIGDTTWKTGNTYVLCTVGNGAASAPTVTGHLVIEPGVTVLFGNSYSYSVQNDGKNWVHQVKDPYYENTYYNYYTTYTLYVRGGGLITAEGTAEQPIVFKPYEKEGFVDAGYWSNINIDASGSVEQRDFVFKYCQFVNGGASCHSVLYFQGNAENHINLTMENCVFDSREIIEAAEAGTLSTIYKVINAVYMNCNKENRGGNVSFKSCDFKGCSRAYIITDVLYNPDCTFTAEDCCFDSSLSGYGALVLRRYATVKLTGNTFQNFVATPVGLYGGEEAPKNLIFSGNTFHCTRAPEGNIGLLGMSLATAFNGREGVFEIGEGYLPSVVDGAYAAEDSKIFIIYSNIEPDSLTLRNIGISNYVFDTYCDMDALDAQSVTMENFKLRLKSGGSLLLQDVVLEDSDIYGDYVDESVVCAEASIDNCTFIETTLQLRQSTTSSIHIQNTTFTQNGGTCLNLCGTGSADAAHQTVLENLTVSGATDGIALDKCSNALLKGLRVSDCYSGICVIGESEKEGGAPLLQNCLLYDCTDGVFAADDASYPCDLLNCTITACKVGARGCRSIRNSILWNCTDYPVAYTKRAQVTYSCLDDNGYPESNINSDPLFADAENHDYHLKSAYGRYSNGTFVNDSETSPCIDAGDPSSPCTEESQPNGSRVNLGCYGNTAQASRSENTHTHSYTATVTPPTCTEQGYTTHTCACGDSYKDTYTDALGHAWDDGRITTAATATAEGVKTFTCTRCGEIKTASVPRTSEWKNTFRDVSAGKWYTDAVGFAVTNELFLGTSENTFSPDGNMTRGMLVTVLWRLDGKPAPTGSNPFADVEGGKWYTAAVVWAAENGIVGGVGGGKFDPNGNVTREQMAAILYRYAGKKGYDTSKRADLSAYPDASQISVFAKDALSWANAEGLINGSEGKLLPKGNATRAQVAAILMRYVSNIVS